MRSQPRRRIAHVPSSTKHVIDCDKATPLPPRGGAGGEAEGRVREGTILKYRVSFLTILYRLRRPVEGLRGSVSSWTNLWVQFYHRHSRESIVILEEGNQPQPRCSQCDMFIPREALNWAHPTSDMCRPGLERKQRRLVVEKTEERKGRVLSAYGTPLAAVP